MNTNTHPLRLAAKKLARRTNRRAVRWGVGGVLVLAGIATVAAYSVQSNWVSETTANADTVAFYQNQTLKTELKTLDSAEAKDLYSSTQATYGAQWNTVIDQISTQRDLNAKAQQKAANKVADKLLFPNLRGEYRAWAEERAQSESAATAKQEAQLTMFTVYQAACRDFYDGKTMQDTMTTYQQHFTGAAILEQRAIEIGLHTCGQ